MKQAIVDFNNLTLIQNDQLNKISDEIKYEYDAIINDLARNRESDINWIVGSVASRNKYQSKLYLRLCRIALVKRLVLDDYDEIIVRVDDHPLANLLKKELKNKVKIICTETFLRKIWRITRPVRQYLIAVIYMICRYLNSSSETINKIKLIQKKIILVDTFVLNTTPGSGGSIFKTKYYDRYYTGMFEYLSKEEKEKIYFIPTVVGFFPPSRAFKSIRTCTDQFLIPDDLLKISDYLKILIHPIRILLTKINDLSFEGINIKKLIEDEKKNTCADQINLLAILYYLFVYRLQQNGISISRYIDWSENQVIDRSMHLGFHTFFPDVKTIGYQGYIISPALHIYIYPNDSEVKGKLVPDEIVVVGKGLIENMKMFTTNVNVVSGPAFRFSKLWDKRINYPDPDYFTILLALPISLSDSKNILAKTLCIMTKEYLVQNKIKIIVKPHPTFKLEQIKQLINYDWDLVHQFSTGDYNSVLEQSNLVVTNASSTALESLTREVPVLIIGNENSILQNPIPSDVDNRMWKLCYSSAEFKEALIGYYKGKEGYSGDFKDIAYNIRVKYFEKPTKENVRKFLGLD